MTLGSSGNSYKQSQFRMRVYTHLCESLIKATLGVNSSPDIVTHCQEVEGLSRWNYRVEVVQSTLIHKVWRVRLVHGQNLLQKFSPNINLCLVTQFLIHTKLDAHSCITCVISAQRDSLLAQFKIVTNTNLLNLVLLLSYYPSPRAISLTQMS